MSECPRCFCDQVYRVSRTTLERLFFVQSFECRMCGYRERVARRGLFSPFGWFSVRRPKDEDGTFKEHQA